MPVRFSTAVLTGVQHGTLASPNRICTGNSDALTRASTASSSGCAPFASHCVACSIAASPSRSGSGARGGEGVARVVGLGGDDRLLDAAAVVAQEIARAVDDARRAAVVRVERVVRAAGEVAVVVDEELGIGARVAVDHLVVVADAEHVVGGRADESQHEQLRGREVLELVDEEMAALALERAPHLGHAEQRFDGAVDLFVVVDRAVGVELVAVLVEHRAEPGDVIALHLDAVRVDEAEPHFARALRDTARTCRCWRAASPVRGFRCGGGFPTRRSACCCRWRGAGSSLPRECSVRMRSIAGSGRPARRARIVSLARTL